MKKTVFCIGAVLAMTLSGCSSTSNPRNSAVYVREFNEMLKLTIDASGTDPAKFVDSLEDPVDYDSVSNATFKPTEACGTSSSGETEYLLRYIFQNLEQRSEAEYLAKIEAVKKAWSDRGLKNIRTVGSINGMTEIAADTELGSTVDYAVSAKSEYVEVISTCTADIIASLRTPASYSSK